MNCRHCGFDLKETFLELGCAPPSNSYLCEAGLRGPEKWYPLRVMVCTKCWLVQTEDYAGAEELFSSDYAYFSSTSRSWLRHAEQFCRSISRRLSLNEKSFVIEIASNDGYLLKNFVAAGIPCLGIEPTAGTADAAERLGIPVVRQFFGKDLAGQLTVEHPKADLIIGNNVYAHVPDINDFTAGMKELLAPGGTITLEFPHLLNLIKYHQFDTVYHEHFSYLSLQTVASIFERAGLRIHHVEKLPTHGGSLRIYGCHMDDIRMVERSVNALLDEEIRFGINKLPIYRDFQKHAERIKNDLLLFLIEQKTQGKTVGAYGAAAKGNTLLNYAGIKPDLIPFVCDAAPSKQGKFLPGSRIPVLSPETLKEKRPAWVMILPWNIADEIMELTGFIREWGGRFVTAVPRLKVTE